MYISNINKTYQGNRLGCGQIWKCVLSSQLQYEIPLYIRTLWDVHQSNMQPGMIIIIMISFVKVTAFIGSLNTL